MARMMPRGVIVNLHPLMMHLVQMVETLGVDGSVNDVKEHIRDERAKHELGNPPAQRGKLRGK